MMSGCPEPCRQPEPPALTTGPAVPRAYNFSSQRSFRGLFQRQGPPALVLRGSVSGDPSSPARWPTHRKGNPACAGCPQGGPYAQRRCRLSGFAEAGAPRREAQDPRHERRRPVRLGFRWGPNRGERGRKRGKKDRGRLSALASEAGGESRTRSASGSEEIDPAADCRSGYDRINEQAWWNSPVSCREPWAESFRQCGTAFPRPVCRP